MLFMDALFNSLLVVSSGYAMYTLHPLQTPYGYTAAGISLMHGLLGVMRAIKNDEGECNGLRLITSGIMDIVPLPLTNIELYLRSSSPHLALAHACFVVPLVYDIAAKVTDSEDTSTETLKELTMLGNVVSMLFLGVNQSSNMYGSMAALAFGARYGPVLLDHYVDGLGANFNLLANSMFIVLMAMTLTVKQI
ncbi:uncharacterized protein Dwil_GK10152 [Drosophila willistoni]|uniref:Uncharacterized protein n=1 Tax=Drosophila willistoni TaxID=7260 RepID=B4ND34_DROWI|nr:uncharacterized protein LOC6648903 [Drosophila willistoni]EDW82743.1 uncharacterized protein Dwil_GK10152 [Drosophila willistoni]